MSNKLHIAVLMGGWSNEREVSLMSGNGVADALEKNGHKVTRVDMDRNIAMVLNSLKPDVVFNALHGVPGEDGSVQGMLDLMQIPYTHSGMACSVIAIDKELTKQQLVPAGIPMPVMSKSNFRALANPAGISKAPSIVGSLIRPFQPDVVRGFSK